MSTMKQNGGPAFPIADHAMVHEIAFAAIQRVTDSADSAERDRLYVEAKARAAAGMSLRDYFAGQAMIAYSHAGVKTIGNVAYEAADSMLEAREAAAPQRREPAQSREPKNGEDLLNHCRAYEKLLVEDLRQWEATGENERIERAKQKIVMVRDSIRTAEASMRGEA